MTNPRGFTIVELLIVIVVIAILAAITIVAFNGISDRAKASSAQSAASQSAKKAMAYAVENADSYPPDLAAIGVSNSGGTTYQYSVNNTTPRSFCITSTTDDVSYYSSNTETAPVAGACPGHGANGVAAITNLALNPSFETNTSSWVGYGTSPGLSRVNTLSQSGSWSYRTAPTGSGYNGTQMLITGMTAGEVYTFAASVQRTAGSGGAVITFEWRNDSNALVGTGVNSGPIASTLNVWQRMSVTGTVPVGATRAYVIVRYISGVASTDVMYIDSVSVTSGSDVPTYADGSSPNWVWNGTANNSTSTGPPL